MDIIIPLAANSYTDNLELRYALRSIQKHLTQVDNIYLIGRKPEWIKNVIHIPANELLGERFRDMNMRKKIMLACTLPGVSENFLYYHDDHFLLKNFKAEKFPLYHKGLLQDTHKTIPLRNPYRDVIMNTIKILIGKQKNTTDFDIHCPMVMNKETFMRITGQIEYQKSFAVKSLYANLGDMKGEYHPDLKIKQQTSISDITAMIKDRPFFSTGDRALGPDMMSVFNFLYPKVSRYE